MSKGKHILKILGLILLMLFGVFMFIYGGYDDSPGGQGLGLLAFVAGLFLMVRISKKRF